MGLLAEKHFQTLRPLSGLQQCGKMFPVILTPKEEREALGFTTVSHPGSTMELWFPGDLMPSSYLRKHQACTWAHMQAKYPYTS